MNLFNRKKKPMSDYDEGIFLGSFANLEGLDGVERQSAKLKAIKELKPAFRQFLKDNSKLSLEEAKKQFRNLHQK
jgi:hypothetical protein